MSVDIIVELLQQQQRINQEMTKLEEARAKGTISDEEHAYYLRQTYGDRAPEQIIGELQEQIDELKLQQMITAQEEAKGHDLILAALFAFLALAAAMGILAYTGSLDTVTGLVTGIKNIIP